MSKIIAAPIDLELSINEDLLNQELMDQPLKYRKWATLEAEAATVMRRSELALEHAKSKAYVRAKSAGVKLTVKDLEAAVALDEQVITKQEELIEAIEMHAQMKTAVRAFMQRHDALKDLAANKRKELID